MLPQINEMVIVAGGLARWDGEHWRSVIDENRVIQWPVTWWLPLPVNEDLHKESNFRHVFSVMSEWCWGQE